MATSAAEVLEGVPHKFKATRVSGSNTCRVCSTPISYGLPRAAHQCVVCESYCHKKCSGMAQPDCVAITPKALLSRTARSGFLLKKVAGSYKRRWCVLTKEFLLYSFKDLNSKAPDEVIMLQKFDDVNLIPGKKAGFAVLNSKDQSESQHHFQADDNEVDQWVTHLQTMMKEYQRGHARFSLRSTLVASQAESGLVRRYQRLAVKVVEGRNLPAMDITGTSDPYVLLMVDSNQVRSSTVWKNKKSPFWGQEFIFPVKDPQKTALIATVWDEDVWDSDDFIGKTCIPIRDVVDGEEDSRWHKLEPRDEEDEFLGDVRLKVKVCPDDLKVLVQVVEARNLAAKDSNGYSDPFVRLRHGVQRKKTKTVKKNLNPYFNEEFEFPLDPQEDTIRVEVWDWDLVGANDLIGICVVRLSEQMPETFNDRWYPLTASIQPKGSSASASSAPGETSEAETSEASLGAIRLTLRYTEVRVLPTRCYNSLLKLLLDKSLEVPLALSVSSLDIEPMAKCLVAIFGSSRDEVRLLEALTKHEIKNTPNPDIIFRGNSGVTKAVDAFMKQVGSGYLQQTLYSHIQNIFGMKKALEIDEMKAEKGENIKRNVQKLSSLCDELLDTIIAAADSMPGSMRAVFRNIRTQVMASYDLKQLETVRYTAISGFLFLRFFVPAIMTPVMFDLAECHAPSHTERTLKLVAKVTQNLANLVEFGEKEPCMKEMNPFIVNRLDEMKGYLNQVSNYVPELSNSCNPKIFLDKELALCVSYIKRCWGRLEERYPDGSITSKLRPVMDEIARFEEEHLDAPVQVI